MGTINLTTERLTLRRYIETDAHVLFLHFGCNPKMFEFSGWNPYATEEMAAETVQHFIDSYEDARFYGWAIESGGELIGTVGAYDYDEASNSIEVGISIKEDAWGNGFATEALRCVIDYLINNEGIGSVVAWSAAENTGSIRAMKKAGMRQTGVEKDGLEVDGKKYDKVMFEAKEDKLNKIIDACLQSKSKNPVKIFNKIAHMNFVGMHGPEHHVLDGAALLTAYYNAGGEIDLQASLEEMAKRGSQIPGAACGLWGVCGAVPSMGAALSIINGTGPLSEDSSWGQHMEFTSKALSRMSMVGGPRCCKRDAFISYETAIKHINANYNVKLEHDQIKCSFSSHNEQCITEKCPYYFKPKKKVAFVCVHNSCRSQIAEALGKKYLSDICDCYSAGTETKPQINQDAVRLMKKVHGINMEKTQYSKLFEDIPKADVIVSMSCNVVCPYIPGKLHLDWGLEDPTGQSDEKFMEIIETIENNVLKLRETLLLNEV